MEGRGTAEEGRRELGGGEIMGVWKRLRGKTEGKSGDQTVKNVVPHA